MLEHIETLSRPDDSPSYATLPSQLESLTEVFGPVTEELTRLVVSNDIGIQAVMPDLRDKLQRQPGGGIGIFIGSGGMYSLLPDLDIDIPVVVDCNRLVGEFSESLGRTLTDYSNELAILDDTDLIRETVMDVLEGRPDYLRRLKAVEGGRQSLNFMAGLLAVEAERYGELHWSNPARLPLVTDAIQKQRPVFIGAVLQSPGLARALQGVCRQHDSSIRFANLTNVHEWIGVTNMGFLRDFPFDPNAVILASSLGKRHLKMSLSGSLDDYFDRLDTYDP